MAIQSVEELEKLESISEQKKDRLAHIYRQTENLADLNRATVTLDDRQKIKSELKKLEIEACDLIRWLADYKEKRRAFFSAPCME